MDQKTWLWKKRYTENTTTASDKVNFPLGGNEEQTTLNDKAEFERELTILNEKLSSALIERNAKDDFAKKQAKVAQEAIAGWQKAEAEAVSLKQELEKAMKQRLEGDERLISMDAALKECMQQLCFVREEQEKRIHDAVMKTSREFEKMRNVLEERLAETSKRLAKLGSENTQLSKALLAKEKVIEDLNEQRTRSEAGFNTLMTRLESTEKENASLKYEVCVLEKELEIRNEEREFNRRTSEVAHKQHLESVKKIAKLESECQRLRLLVRKRLPGPAAVAKMKFEVDMLGRDPPESRRRRSNSSTGSMDFAVSAPDTPSKRINFLTEQLFSMEEENRTIKETLNKRTNDLQLSRTLCGQTASRLSQVEAQLEKSSKDQITFEPARNLPTPHELSLASMSDIGNDEKTSCAESWASALISELEHFKNGKQTGTRSCNTVGASDINLMDDFVEMEKLAIVSVDKSFSSSRLASEGVTTVTVPSETHSCGYSSEATGREILPVSECQCNLFVPKQEIQSENMSIDKNQGWLNDIVKVVLEQTRATQRNADEILEDIKVALAYINHPDPCDSINTKEISSHPDISGDNSWKLPNKSSAMYSQDRLLGNKTSLAKKSNQQFHSNLSESIRKMVELIDGISLPSPHYSAAEILTGKGDNCFPCKISETPTGYMVRVFQWKTSDLNVVVQKFVQTCNDLLHGKADIEKYAEELTSAFEWITNHCFSLQDVPSMTDAIKNHFDWDESKSESEVEGELLNHFSEADKLLVSKENRSYSPIVSDWNSYKTNLQTEELWSNMREDSRRLKDLANIERVKKDLEGKLQLEIGKNETLLIQLQDSEKTIQSLRAELETLTRSKEKIEDQIESQKIVKEDLDSQLTVVKIELSEVFQKLSILEEELDHKCTFCEELEATCLDLQLQLESMTKKEILKCELEKEAEKQHKNDLEITAASEKLAECQETIVNLGRQLKAMASPRDASLFNKVTSTLADAKTTTNNAKRNNIQRTSLLDKMLAEDNGETGNLRSPKTKEIICTSDSPAVADNTSFSAFHLNSALHSPAKILNLNGIKHQGGESAVNSLPMVPGKKKGSGGMLKKLLSRRNKSNIKKLPLTYGT